MANFLDTSFGISKINAQRRFGKCYFMGTTIPSILIEFQFQLGATSYLIFKSIVRQRDSSRCSILVSLMAEEAKASSMHDGKRGAIQVICNLF